MHFFTNKELSIKIADVDNKLNLAPKPVSNLTSGQAEVAEVSAAVFEEMCREFRKEPIPLDEDNIKNLSKLVFDMYMTKLNLTKDRSSENGNFSETIKNVDNCLMNSLALLYPEESNSNFKSAEIIFEFMLNSILYDVHEEVIGQERPIGALPKLIDKELSDRGIRNTPELKRIAATLYPLALLASYFAEKAKIPAVQKREMALNFDVHTFLREYMAQFGEDRSDIWTGDFLAECMVKIWDAAEKNKNIET